MAPVDSVLLVLGRDPCEFNRIPDNIMQSEAAPVPRQQQRNAQSLALMHRELDRTHVPIWASRVGADAGDTGARGV